MINLRIYNILLTLSRKDWDNIILHIKSTDAISERKYLPLLLELKKFSKSPQELTKIPASKIFEEAYKKTYNAQTVFNRQNEFLNLLKKYLENNAYTKNKLFSTNFYFEELLSRNLTSIFPYEYKKKKNIIENSNYDEESFNILSKLILYNTEYISRKNKNKNIFDSYFNHSKVLLADILSSLYRSGQQLQIYNYYNVKQEFDPLLGFIDSIASDEYFEKLESKNEPIFTVPLVRYYIYKCFQCPDCRRYISKVKKIYFANEKQFPEYFKIYIYKMIMTYYNVKINNGELKYFKNLFVLYKKKLKQNLVSDVAELNTNNTTIFREYVIVGLKVNQFKWVDMVIKKYSPLLPEIIRSDEYILALVRLHFAKKEYENAIKNIDSTKIRNIIHHTDSIKIKLASFYELKKYEKCYLEIDRVKHYLKNNKKKFPENNFKRFKKFIDIFLRLLNYKTNPFNKDIHNILFEIEKSNFSMKDWVKEKIEEAIKT